MDWQNLVGGVIQQAMSGQAPSQEQIEQHFDQTAQNASPGELAQGLASAFRSDQTPPFAQMVSGMFQNSTGDQRAGLLNQLISSAGPTALAGLAGGGGLGSLTGLLSGGARITPEQASDVSADDVQALAAHVEQHNPSVIDHVSGFYSQHPTAVKALGAAAMWAVISHFGDK